MKKLFPILLSLSLLSNCKDEDVVLFDMAYQAEFTIPAGINPFETHYFYIRDIPVGTYLSANGVEASDLKSIDPGVARFTALFAGAGEYGFIQEVSIELLKNNEERGREAFWRNQIPLNEDDQLDIFGTLIDASEYFESQKFDLVVILRLNGAPQQTIETRLNFSFQAR